MILLAARYSFLFWMLIGSNNGDLLLTRSMEGDDQHLYRISACTAKCLLERRQAERRRFNEQQHQKQETITTTESEAEGTASWRNITQHPNATFLAGCFDFCRHQNATLPLRQIDEHLYLRLICRDDRSLTFRVNAKDEGKLVKETTDNTITNTPLTFMETAAGDTNTSTTQAEWTSTPEADMELVTVFVIKFHALKERHSYLVYLSDKNFFTIENLKHNATHNIVAVAVNSNQEYSMIAKGKKYRTLRRGYTPGKVQDIQMKNFKADELHEMRLTADIIWKPAEDLTCHYNIICFSLENDDLTPLEIRNTQQLYSYQLDNLTFSSVYKIGIRAKNPNNNSKESEIFWETFQTPYCLDWYKNNASVCAPEQPQDLEVAQNFVGKNGFSLSIRWEQPKHLPDFYTLKVQDLWENGSICVHQANLSNHEISLFLPYITLYGIMFEVHLTAYSPGGNATAVVKELIKMHVLVPDKNHIAKLISAILASIFCIAILSLAIFIICHRRAKLKRWEERCKYFEDLEKKAPIDPKANFDFCSKTVPLLTSADNLTQYHLDLQERIFFNDAMEIERENIKLYEVLGEGAFGLVRRGIYTDEKLGEAREVAVKMLKDRPASDEVRAFRSEIEVMKSVERHPNIVGIIGHCTRSTNEMMLLTEYCSFGNLLNFLRNEWNYLHELKNFGEQGLKNKQQLAVTRVQRRIILPKALGQMNKTNRVTITKSQSSIRKKNVYKINMSQRKSNNNNSNNTNKNNKSNNLDTTMIQKIKHKYRYFILSNASTNASKQTFNDTIHSSTTTTTGTDITMATAAIASVPAIPIGAAAHNRSYGYDEICTNACKCQVDVLMVSGEKNGKQQQRQQYEPELELEHNQTPEITHMSNSNRAVSSIRIRNCDCKRAAERRSAPPHAVAGKDSKSVENKSYYKYLRVPTLRKVASTNRTTTTCRKTTHRARTAAGVAEAGAQQTRRLAAQCQIARENELLMREAKREPLSAGDLMDIARQVAVGMEFLAKNKVVHRDLAARNVLVAADRTIKIADFGLSRDVYQENIYRKTGNGKLPIKWLALESMTHQVYTTQSDVWSYGILMYEIVTLGGTPYPSIATNRLLHLLKTGYRMEQPKHCGPQLYNLMLSCWHVNPAERPSFTQIIRTLESLIAESPEKQIENLTAIRIVTKSKSDEVTSTESYLKPL